MNILFYIGAVLTISVVITIGVLSGKKTNKQSFSGDRVFGPLLVAGSLIGTLVGGSSTIGTAQLAYTNGLSAWWFTLGGSFGVILFGFVVIKKIYNSEYKTIPDIITKKQGLINGKITAFLSSIGTFLSFIAQIISGSALLMTIFPLSNQISIIIVLILMFCYVFFGGALSLGKSGIAKTIVLSIAIVVCGIVSITKVGGIGSYVNNPYLPKEQYFNLFSRGIMIDGGAGLSLIIGVLTTQSYLSALLSAKDIICAKKGALMTALIVPVIGLCSVLVGEYMFLNYPNINTKQALPLFIIKLFPPLVSGVMIAALLIAVIGTGAGLCMGISTMITRNLLEKQKNEILWNRIIIFSCYIIGGVICVSNLNEVILNWSFLSMGLRGAVSLFPMLFSLQTNMYIGKKAVFISIVLSVIAIVFGKIVLPETVDPLFLGLSISFVILLLGKKRRINV